MKRYLAAAMLLLALSGCGSSGSSTQLYTTTEDFFAMDTYMSVDVSSEKSESAAEDMAVKIEQRVNQLDAALSRTQQAGDLYKLNHANGQPTEVSDDTYTALEKALEYAEMTNGAFDPTMAPLTDLWGIGTDNARVPAQSEIDEALTHVGYQNVKLLGNNQVQLLNGAQVDLGGIGKGYAGDIVHEMAESDTSDQWHVLARLSGNIEMYGGKTADSGTDDWNIGIADPDDNTDSIAVVSLRDGSVVTSGDYERFFEKDGKRYHHIFDPATGYPADSGLRGVTVIDPCSTKADALTTALFVMGLDKGMKFCEENKIAAVFITADKQVYTTSAPGRLCIVRVPRCGKRIYPMLNKLKFGDFIIIGVVLVMAGALAAALTFHSSGDKLYAEVWQNDTLIERVQLTDATDRTIKLDGNTIVLSGKTAKMADADCRDPGVRAHRYTYPCRTGGGLSAAPRGAQPGRRE